MATAPDEPERSPHNRSVLRAVALLQCFVEAQDGLTLSELARRTGMSSSTAHRILGTLCVGGVLRRGANDERYFPGVVLLALAGAAFREGGLAASTEVLHSLTARTGESSSLGIADGTCVVVLASVESPRPLRAVDAPPGSRVPLHVSALGKALMAFGPQPTHEAVAALGRLASRTRASIVSAQRLRDELDEARARGYAFVDGEQEEGVRAIAVPILDHRGVARASIALQAPAPRMDLLRRGELFACLRESAGLVAALPDPVGPVAAAVGASAS